MEISRKRFRDVNTARAIVVRDPDGSSLQDGPSAAGQVHGPQGAHAETVPAVRHFITRLSGACHAIGRLAPRWIVRELTPARLPGAFPRPGACRGLQPGNRGPAARATVSAERRSRNPAGCAVTCICSCLPIDLPRSDTVDRNAILECLIEGRRVVTANRNSKGTPERAVQRLFTFAMASQSALRPGSPLQATIALIQESWIRGLDS